jgi:S-adenosylmethionine:tRNA ribosyltransferase-isomerase
LELPELLRPADLMVFNNTKVFPARLLGHRLGMASQSYLTDKTPSATIEVLLLKPLGNDVWEVLVKPGRKMRVGERVRFGSRLECEVVDRGDLGSRTVKFSYQGNFDNLVDLLGHVPLRPTSTGLTEQRRLEYQTIFARKRCGGRPTAGCTSHLGCCEGCRRGIETCDHPAWDWEHFSQSTQSRLEEHQMG